MTTKNMYLYLMGAAVAALPCVAFSDDNDTINEVTRQVTRQISQSITKRVAETTGTAAKTTDQNDFSNDFWVNPQYTDIGSSGSSSIVNVKNSTKMYSMLFGADHRIGDFFVGASANFSHSDSISATNVYIAGLPAGLGINPNNSRTFSAESWSISPYGAYKFNENVFASGIIGYANSIAHGSSNSSTDTFLTDFALNGVTNLSGVGLSGKFGYRSNYTQISGSTKFFTQTAYVSGEISYKISDFRPYMNTSWEHIVFDQAQINDLDQVYTSFGVDYSIKSNMSLGVYYTRELTGNTATLSGNLASINMVNTYNAAGANFKLKF